MSVGCDRSLKRFKEIVDHIDRSCVDGAPLHLKIKAYHADIARDDRQATKLHQSEIVELLLLLSCFLKHIDPDGQWPFGEVYALIVHRAYPYYDIIVKQTTEGGYDLVDALKMYESFYYLHRQTTWGDFPVKCV